MRYVVLSLFALALVACEGKPADDRDVNFNAPVSGSTFAFGGTAVQNNKSKCAGNVNVAGGSSRGNGDEGSQGGGTTATGSNTSDCTENMVPAEAPVEE